MIVETIERLKSVVELKFVGGSADFQKAAESNPKVTPCAFVFPLEEQPGASQLVDVVIQRVAAAMSVMLVVRNVSDTYGVAAQQDLARLRKAIKESLLGWVPLEGHDPFERGPSNLMVFKDGYMWWQDVYTTAFYDRSVL